MFFFHFLVFRRLILSWPKMQTCHLTPASHGQWMRYTNLLPLAPCTIHILPFTVERYCPCDRDPYSSLPYTVAVTASQLTICLLLLNYKRHCVTPPRHQSVCVVLSPGTSGFVGFVHSFRFSVSAVVDKLEKECGSRIGCPAIVWD